MGKGANNSKMHVRARRLAAYYIWPELNTGSILNTPPRKLLWMLSEQKRWREGLDRAAQLLETIAEEMNALSRFNSDEWHSTDIGVVFQQNLEEVIELQDQLDDLRSNF
jgi:hypothetical protein